MKKKIYGAIKLITFLLILFICFVGVHKVTERKTSHQIMEDFFKEKNFDILFFGNSHAINGIFPMQLWKDYGITSYNLGRHAAYLACSYNNMLLALKETTPKMIVIDVYSIESNGKVYDESYLHDMLDAYPISYTKYLAIKDLFGEEKLLENEFEYLFNFSMYHERWDELTKNDFRPESKYEKGAESRIGVAITNKMSDFNSIDTYNKEETLSMEYLRKMIEYCQEKDIEVLVTYLPHPATDKMIAVSKYTQSICDEYDVNYINFLDMDIVNYDTDYQDKDSHLNPSGARKITDYLGKYITENYDILDQRENKAYSFWNEDYNEYIDLKISNLANNEKNLNNYLMLLYGEEDIKYEIKISNSREIKEGTTIYNLLANLGNNYEIDDSVFEENKDKTIKITTYDNRDGSLIKTVWF